ncbi:MAG: hypothetical protein KDA37_00135 [Planctomycetales bacterium]|nr:hypothetical protein [Planctomycetales bacterium]
MKTIGPDVELPLASFAENGVATLRRHVDENAADELRREIEAFCQSEAIFAKADAGSDVDGDRYLLNCTARRFQSYHQLAQHPLPVVLVRNRHQDSQSADHGMIDIFNAERLFPACGDVLRADRVRKLLQDALGGVWRLDRQHVYINRGVHFTRPWHIDAAGSPCIKMFVYLTNVLEMEEGPLGYVLGSHRESQDIEAIGGGNYAVDLQDERTAIVLARRGDAALAFTRGVHRGMPQSPGRLRIAVVGTFYPG